MAGREQEENYKYETAYFGGGCFWCMEGIFEAQKGVKEAVVGYMGGSAETANYSDVSSGTTQHREAVKIIYDPRIISYEALIDIFWRQIDPTDAEGQFADKGFQYTTAIYYKNEIEKIIAENSKNALETSKKFKKKVATLILPFPNFFEAEEYHQNYYKNHAFRYGLYKKGSGREEYIKNTWTSSEHISDSNKAFASEQTLKNTLSPLQFEVTQKGGTETPFENEYWDHKEDGIYVDIVDGTPLFSSTAKFDSGTGWPSFTQPIEEKNIGEKADYKLGMMRTEVKSQGANCHLGHVFPDGPKAQGGMRYCINSAALRFIPLEKMEEEGYGKYLDLFEEEK